MHFTARFYRITITAVWLLSSALLLAQDGPAELEALHNQTVELYRAARYREAIEAGLKAVAMAQRIHPPEHPDVAKSLNNLAVLYTSQGQYAEAEPLLWRALAINEKMLGPEHPDTAASLNNIAELYRTQGKYALAEPLYARALAIREKVLGPDDPATAGSVNNLGLLYFNEGQFAKAQPLYIRALAINEKSRGPDHPDTATSLNNLALLYSNQGQFAKAEPLYIRALAIKEKVLGPDHPNTIQTVNNLALLYQSQGQSARAERLYIRALDSNEKTRGPDHPDTATVLLNLATLYEAQGRYAEAEPLYARALVINEKVLGPEHPATAQTLNNLALLYQDQGQYAKAEPLYTRALTIKEKMLGPDQIDTALSLNNLAFLYHSQGQYAKAEPLYARALGIYETMLGPDHPNTALALNNLAEMYEAQRQYARAEPLYTRALSIRERVLDPGHPDIATSLTNLAGFYANQGQYAKAEPLYARALVIRENALGNHPDTAGSLNNLAELYESQGQHARAKPLFTRALAVDEKVLGPDHPGTAAQADNLVYFLADNGGSSGARKLLRSYWPHRISWLDRSLMSGRETYRRSWLSDFRSALSLLIALQNSPGLRSGGLDAVLKTKNRISEELGVALGSLRGLVDPESGRQLDALQDVWRQQQHLESTNPADAVSRTELKEQEDKLVAEISTRVVEFRELTKTPSLADVRSQLGDSALVEMVQFDEVYLPRRKGMRFGPAHYGAYLLRRVGDIGWLDLGPTDVIDKSIRQYRLAVSSEANEAFATIAAQYLERLIFEPVRRALPSVREFYIAPDGLLHLIPFGALPDEGGQPLLRRFALHILSTGRDLVPGDSVAPAQSSVVSGIESFGEQNPERPEFPDLQGAGSEADAVAKIIPDVQRVAADRMTRGFLLERVNAPRILHLATHGYYHPDEPGNETDPLTRSGIALS